MGVATVGSRHNMGRPKKDIDAVTMRVERDAYEIARKVAATTGESIMAAASRLIRIHGKAEILANAKRIVSEMGSDE